MNTYIGIDLGTSGVKLLLVNAAGDMLAQSHGEYPVIYPRPGWTEQEPRAWLSAALDGLRDMLEEKYPEIEIVDAPYFYDAGVFNKSERAGCLLLTLDAWAGVHPSLVTIPAEWDYRVPYGLLYPKTPSRCVTAFLESLGL